MFALMTNREIYRSFLQQLQAIYHANEAAIITDWVMEGKAGLQRADIVKAPDQPVDEIIQLTLERSLQELLEHKPVQYVLGEAWFFRMKLKVNEQVLIPRPETEELVQLVIDHYKALEPTSTGNRAKQHAMLDIGTGSGCMAIAVKKNLPGISMQAIDVSDAALDVAKENALVQQVTIDFLQIDFLDNNSWKALPVFDTIISNPPYIPLNERELLDRNVTAFEPHTALFVPDDRPLLFYEKIAAFGKDHLAADGKIFMEIHEDLADSTAGLFNQQDYQVEIKQDLFGKERMIVARKAGRFV